MTSKSDPSLWPTDASTGAPLEPRAQPGYYPGQHALTQQAFWDEATRRSVLARVQEVPPFRFFQPEEVRCYLAVFARILPQDDRDEAHRIPLLPFMDARLWEGRGDGYRYEDMPPDPDAFRLGHQGIEAAARALFKRGFVELSPSEQDDVLGSIRRGEPPPGAEQLWSRLPPRRFFLMLVSNAVEVYYAHPFAWDEVGFGGPAYPRGYMRLERGDPEPWEMEEQRYDWKAPAGARSDVFEPEEASSQTHAPGQGGTH